MADFTSNGDIDRFVEVVKAINPQTVIGYGPALDRWALLAKISSAIGTRAQLVSILKLISPTNAVAYGPLLDAWAEQPFNRQNLAAILHAVNPWTVSGYGPLLDAWAMPAFAAHRVVRA